MDHAVVGFHEKLHSEGSSQIRFAAHLPMACRFRSGFVYNNALYGVVGELIHRVCGKSTSAVMKEKIFEPLEQGRTGTSSAEYPPDGNVARGYSLLDNGSLLRLNDPELEGDSAHAGAGAVRSIVNDMLTWARQVMEAESRQSGLREGLSSREELLPGLAFAGAAQLPITLSARVLLTLVRDTDGRISGLEWDLYTGGSEELLSRNAARIKPVRFDRIL